MPSSATAYLAEVDLEETRSIAVTPGPLATGVDDTRRSESIYSRHGETGEVASQPTQRYLQYFATLAHHYSTLLSRMERDVNLLRDAGRVMYLIDEDVIRNIVEVRYGDERVQLQAENLLASKEVHYSIPLGAFQELLIWLSALVPGGLTIWSEGSVRVDDLVKDLRHLARACNVDPAGSPLEVTAKIASALEADKLRVARLVSLLRRCHRVEADYDVEDMVRIKKIIAKIPRPARRSDLEDRGKRGVQKKRDKVDERDAINLAIVFKRLREGRQLRHDKETFILLTETDALKNLVEHTRRMGFDSMRELADLLCLPADEVTEGMCPVLTPESAFIVEEFRIFNGFGEDAFRQLRNVQYDYQELGDVLRGAARNPHRKENALATSGDIQKKIREKLDRLKMVYDHDTFYRRLEQSRATEISIQYLREKYKPGSIPPKQQSENLKVAMESFLRVVRDAYQEIEEVAVTSYLPERKSDDSGAFDSVTVYSQHPTELVLEGEVYRQSSRSGEKTDRAYSFRWPTSCTDRQFLAAVGDIVRLPERSVSAPKPKELRPMSSFEPVLSGGIVLFTNVGAYGVAFEDLPPGLSLGRVALEELLKAAREQGGANLVLEAVRVCAPFADFQLDIGGNEFGGREVFVISRYNIGPQIVHLCSFTSLLVILPLRLNDALQQAVTARFPVYQNASAA